MDIDLLSKIVKEIILDKDEVSLPGVGSFVAEIVPSVFSDKGYTINPPYKRLYFRQKENPQDTSLVDFYAASNKLEPKMAAEILTDFLKELRQILETKKNIIFPGLGRLRATKENYFFFVADENLDIYPEGFGLEPISLKTHEETTSEVSRTMATLKSILSPEEADDTAVSEEDNVQQPEIAEMTEVQESVTAQETAPVNTPEENMTEELPEDPEKAVDTLKNTETVETGRQEDVHAENPEKVQEVSAEEEAPETAAPAEPKETTEENQTGQTSAEERASTSEEQLPEEVHAPAEATEPAAQPEPEADQSAPEQKKKSIRKTIGWTAVIILALTLTALAAFIFLAHVAPDFIDSILYTPEELEIINR